MNASEKVAFISGLKGTSIYEVIIVAFVFPLSFVFNRLIMLYYDISVSYCESDEKDPKMVLMLMLMMLDYVTLVFPVLIIFCFPQYWIFIYALLFCFMYPFAKGFLKPSKNKSKNKNDDENENEENNKLWEPLTIHRSFVMIGTIIAILAVDFPVFPRRFAKTEYFGVSLMDIGVGSFVVVNGIAAGLKKRNTGSNNKSKYSLRKILKSYLPLLALGIIRLMLLKGIEYQEHIGEYGYHWNFFFTLLVISILPSMKLWMSLSIIFGYQYCISTNFMGIRDLLIDDGIIVDRSKSFFLANKEGILSIFGYCSMHGIVEEIGKPQFYHFIFFTAMAFMSIEYVDDVSRRMMNSSYVFWCISYNYGVLLTFEYLLRFSRMYSSSSLTSSSSSSSLLLKAINDNMMVIFLVGNIVTGLTNIFVDTLHTSDDNAIIILSLYTFVVLVIIPFAFTLTKMHNNKEKRQ